MKTAIENNALTIWLEGRIDSNNAAAIEQEIGAAVKEAPGTEIVLDAGKLEYISSAGLRVLMRLRRQAGKALAFYDAGLEEICF